MSEPTEPRSTNEETSPESDREINAPSGLQRHYRGIIENGEIGWKAERKLLRCLGVGGQGRVYLSRRFGAGQFTLPVALKLFSPEPFKSNADYQVEVTRIAKVAAEVACIQHDNVVAVQDFIEMDGIMVMEMEWLDGYDLRCLLTPTILQQVRSHATQEHWEQLNSEVVTRGQAQSRLKPRMAIAILRKCLHGLSSLHQAQIVHNDLKPSNIMLKRTGNVKLIDIGSAFCLADGPCRSAFTPEFAAPEVLAGSAATIQSDLASLGFVLIEMLSGMRPFHNVKLANMVETKRNIFPALQTFLPREEFAYFDLLLPLLRRLVASDPDQRFASAHEADQAADGAAAFEEELVKGNLSYSSELDIREWMHEVDIASHPDNDLGSTKSISSSEQGK